MDDMKIAWVALNTGLTRVENAIACLGGVPDLGDNDLVDADSLDSSLGLIELDLIRVRELFKSSLVKVEGAIRGKEMQVL